MKRRSLFLLAAALLGNACCCPAAAPPAAAAMAPAAQGFDDITLAQALALASQANHDGRLALAMVQNAQAAILVANNAPNPTLTLQTFNINPSQGIGSGGLRRKTVDSTVRLDQLFERGDKRGLRTRNAEQLEQAARADLADSARQLALAVTQSYYNLLAAQEKLRLFDDTTRLFDNALAAAGKRKDAGDIAGADVARIEVDLFRARNDGSAAVTELRRARLALGLLLGRSGPALLAGATPVPGDGSAAGTGWQSTGAMPQAAPLRAVDHWPQAGMEPSENTSDQALTQAVAARADVRAARARLDAAMTAQRQAVALRTRDISVGVQAEHWPQNGGNSYGVAVQIPLFVRNEYNGEIRSATIAVQSAQTTLEKTSAAAQGDVWRAREELRSAAERVQRFEGELLEASGKSAQAAEFAFRKGAIGVMDVLDARRVQRATQLEAIAAQADHAKALAAWHTAIATESQP
ncbi:MAG: TolC family protein [Janthinobacterium lividum]